MNSLNLRRALLSSLMALCFLVGGAAYAQPTDYVSLWKGEGNADDATGTNIGTLVGNTTFTSGKVGQAFSFDGSGDMVRMEDSPSLDITGSMTISAWFKTNGSRMSPGTS